MLGDPPNGYELVLRGQWCTILSTKDADRQDDNQKEIGPQEDWKEAQAYTGDDRLNLALNILF